MARNGLRGGASHAAAGPIPFNLSSHALRAARHYQARVRNESRIRELEETVHRQASELRSWRNWWYGYDQDIAERAEIVAQSLAIHKQDCVKLGRDVHVAASAATQVGGDDVAKKLAVHRRAALAKHCGFVAEDVHDPFAMLSGMVSATIPASGSGGILCTTFDGCDIFFDGESLVNSAIAKRCEARKMCGAAVAACSMAQFLPPHIMDIGDIVWLANDSIPSWVVRVGHSDYAGSIRIRSFREPKTYEAGRWVHHASCYMLERGDTVVATRSVVDSSEHRDIISIGHDCCFQGRDVDGDVILSVTPAINGRSDLIIFIEDLVFFSLV